MPFAVLDHAVRRVHHVATIKVRSFAGTQINIGFVTTTLAIETGNLVSLGMYPFTGLKVPTGCPFNNAYKITRFAR